MTLPTFTLLLAQARANNPRPGDWSFGWGTVGIIAAASAGIVMVIWLIMLGLKLRARRTTHSPWELFGELCAAHRLAHGERSLLKSLARDLKLEQPGVLFVEPGWWESQRLPPSMVRHVAALEKVRKRLFAPR